MLNAAPNRIDLIGQTFGAMTVLALHSTDKLWRLRWLCRCVCGTEKVVMGSCLRHGSVSNCGCVRRANLVRRNLKHGLSYTTEYRIWRSMWSRCVSTKHLAKNPQYAAFVPSDEWKDFERFLSDMGPRPSLKHSLDRIDNDKRYSKDNCRWATQTDQNRNKRNNLRLTFNGETMPAAAWAERFALPQQVIYRRIAAGWTIDRVYSELVAKAEAA